MRTGWIVNAALLVVVAGMAAYAYFRPGAEEAARHKVMSVTQAGVERIIVHIRDGSSIELAKRGDDWFLVRPFEARADRSQVERVLELLDATSKEKLAATDLARFDLDNPRLAVELGDARIAFGTVNPLTQEQYVLAGDSVYLLSAFYRSLVPQSADRLLAHNLFLGTERPVAFVLEAFKVEQRDGKWHLTPPPDDATAQPSQDEFNAWVEAWRRASSLITRRAEASAPKARIEVSLTDGRKLALGVAQRSPELVLVRPDEQLQFHFSAEMARQLLSPPTAAPVAAAEPASSVHAQ